MTSLNNNDMLVCKIKYHGALIYFILSKLHYLVNAFVYGNSLKQMTNFSCKKDNNGGSAGSPTRLSQHGKGLWEALNTLFDVVIKP